MQPTLTLHVKEPKPRMLHFVVPGDDDFTLGLFKQGARGRPRGTPTTQTDIAQRKEPIKHRLIISPARNPQRWPLIVQHIVFPLPFLSYQRNAAHWEGYNDAKAQRELWGARGFVRRRVHDTPEGGAGG